MYKISEIRFERQDEQIESENFESLNASDFVLLQTGFLMIFNIIKR